MLKKVANLTIVLTVALFIAVPGFAFAAENSAGDDSSVDAYSQYLSGQYDGSVEQHRVAGVRTNLDSAGSGAFEDAYSQYLAGGSDMTDSHTNQVAGVSNRTQRDDSEDAYSQYLAGEFCVDASTDLASRR